MSELKPALMPQRDDQSGVPDDDYSETFDESIANAKRDDEAEDQGGGFVIDMTNPDDFSSWEKIRKLEMRAQAEYEKKPGVNIWSLTTDHMFVSPIKGYLDASKLLKAWPRFEWSEEIEDPKQMMKMLQERALREPAALPEVILIYDISHELTQEQIARFITELRNNPLIPRQPLLISATNIPDFVDDQKLDVGADVTVDPNDQQFWNIFAKSMKSTTDLLNNIEDNYGEKMFKGKQSFYAEYQGKLQDRSHITADTEQELQILNSIFKEHGVHDVLDAGVGEGRIALPLAQDGYTITGIDSSTELIKHAKEKKGGEALHLVNGDIRDIPVVEKSEDAIMYNWHVFCDLLGNKSKSEVLSEAYRVLRDGGVIVLDIPDRELLEDRSDGVYLDNPGGKNIFIGYVPTAEEMKTHLAKSGFGSIEIRKWKTAQGFPKLTFSAKKLRQSNVRDTNAPTAKN